MSTNKPRTPEEYQEEMMRLYRASQASASIPKKTMASPMQELVKPSAPEPESKPQPMPEPVESPVPESKPQPMPEPVESPVPEPKPQPMPEPVEPPVPEPTPQPMPEPAEPPATEPIPQTLPEPEPTAPMMQPRETLKTKPKSEYIPETAVPPDHDSVGWIQVITRTAGNAMALPGVSVLITNGSGSQMKLEQVAITNESGETDKIALPVPAVELSLDKNETRQPYATYDVSVYASGYYRQVSKSVPVFAGITSRQIFSMIPLPIYPQEQPETITYQNTEPRF